MTHALQVAHPLMLDLLSFHAAHVGHIAYAGLHICRTVQVAEDGKAKVVHAARGRAVQMNAGAAAATGEHCHAASF